MPTCDVCNAPVSESQGTVYSADEFRSLVRQGYEPPASVRSMMTALGMSVEQWKSGLVASSPTPWLLCPSCAAGARGMIPRAAGSSAGSTRSGAEGLAALFNNMDEKGAENFAQLLNQMGGPSATPPRASAPKKRVPCPHCGGTKDENENPCPHCGFTEWPLVVVPLVIALGCVAAVVFWFESTGWLIAISILGALFALVGGVFLILNLRALRRVRDKPRPAADTSDEEEDEDDEPAPAVPPERAAPPARRPTEAPARVASPASDSGAAIRQAMAILDDAYLVRSDEELEKRVDTALDHIAGFGGAGIEALLERVFRDMTLDGNHLRVRFGGDMAWNEWLKKRAAVEALLRARATAALPRLTALAGADCSAGQFHDILRPVLARAVDALKAVPAAAAKAEAEPLRMTCPCCQARLRVKATSAGKKVTCPQCKQVVSVPRLATPS
jgi:hypothetical protein